MAHTGHEGRSRVSVRVVAKHSRTNEKIYVHVWRHHRKESYVIYDRIDEEEVEKER